MLFVTTIVPVHVGYRPPTGLRDDNRVKFVTVVETPMMTTRRVGAHLSRKAILAFVNPPPLPGGSYAFQAGDLLLWCTDGMFLQALDNARILPPPVVHVAKEPA